MRADERKRLSAEYVYQADAEMQNAEIMRNNARYPAACFHAQQAAEGMLKAALLAGGIDSPRVHHLEDLMELIPEPQKTRMLQHRAKALLLEKYYLPTRYVDALGGKAPAKVFTLRDADEAIEAAGAIVASCGEITGQPVPTRSGRAVPSTSKGKPATRPATSGRKLGQKKGRR